MSGENRTIGKIGEFNLIDRIKQIVPSEDRSEIIIGIGDDTAVLRIDEGQLLLLTCDIQVENRHFRLQHTTAYQLGRRAMAVNLSDIAAMGGEPTYGLVSLGLPKSFSVSAYDRLFEGMHDQLGEFSSIIVGGNLSQTEKQLIIDITLLGKIVPEQLVTRNGAKIGDRIFVTGNIGSSGAGFHVLEQYGNNYPKKYMHFVQAHREPVPRITAGRRIAESGLATAMIDISDGLAGDLYHICNMSGVGAEVYQNQIPLPSSIHEIAKISGQSPLQITLHGGEDYELLFTAKPEFSDQKQQAISQELNLSITEIGQIVSKEEGYHLINDQNQKIPIRAKGWDHFSL